MSFLLDYFRCVSEDSQVWLSFFSLCLQILHIRSFSIIQKKYLIFIPKWKLFYNVVWNRRKMGARDKRKEGPEGQEGLWSDGVYEHVWARPENKHGKSWKISQKERGKRLEMSKFHLHIKQLSNISHLWSQGNTRCFEPQFFFYYFCKSYDVEMWILDA